LRRSSTLTPFESSGTSCAGGPEEVESIVVEMGCKEM